MDLWKEFLTGLLEAARVFGIVALVPTVVGVFVFDVLWIVRFILFHIIDEPIPNHIKHYKEPYSMEDYAVAQVGRSRGTDEDS